MSTIPPQFRLDARPVAAPDAVVQTAVSRFTVLTDRLIRLEYAANGRFEDRASQPFWYREQPAPDFTVARQAGWLTIETDYLRLRYEEERPFAADTLSITLKGSDAAWHFGDADPGNLKGTARTLDGVSGDTVLEPGLLSRSGWALVDDSHTLLFTADGWLTPRENEALDLYFFGYGQDAAACRRDFAAVAGAAPLLPRWALGNWWSRYWAYTQQELADLMRDFRAHDVPLSVCIIDMDWHLDGWTGYTWNRELFPDPPGFLEWLHAQGLRTALNLHPADGVGPHETMYAQMAQRLGVDPATRQPVPFNIADPDFTAAYFELLHHPQEEDGVDFWWIDWQQGETSGLPGLDPLWWLNHLHFYDLMRDGQKRPFIFSRWGGLGNHRTPIGFSGDTYVDWPSLAFQPYFTSTAANVGYGWWSHDIGGHQRGVESGELYTRWVQFGVFSPIMRLHSSKNPFHERRPWGYDAAVEQAARDAMQLRHALIPYLYTMAWRNADEHKPPVRPMYHDYPQQEAAYHCPQQYTFGTELIAAPYVEPADAETRLSRQVIWLPPGDWYHFFDGQYFAGDGWHARYGDLADVPVFAKAGAIVPLGPRVGWGGVDNPAALHVHVFAGADNEFVLYEDDGETLAHRDGAFALTTFRQQWRETGMTVTVGAVTGDDSLAPDEREYTFVIHGVREPENVTPALDGRSLNAAAAYDASLERLTVGPVVVGRTAVFTLTLATNADTLLSRRDRTVAQCHDMVRAFRLQTNVKDALAQKLPQIVADPDLLAYFAVNLSESQQRALLEVTQQAGVHRHPHWFHGGELILWNNRQSAAAYTMTTWVEAGWAFDEQFRIVSNTLPKFQTFKPTNVWRLEIRYGKGQTAVYTQGRDDE